MQKLSTTATHVPVARGSASTWKTTNWMTLVARLEETANSAHNDVAMERLGQAFAHVEASFAGEALDQGAARPSRDSGASLNTLQLEIIHGV